MDDEDKIDQYFGEQTYFARIFYSLRMTLYSFLSNEYTFFIFGAAIIGFLSGLANYVFVFCYESLYQFIVNPLWSSPSIVLPTVCGGIILVLLSTIFPPSLFFGYGFPKFLEQINVKSGAIKLKETFAKTLGSLITLGFGG